ncbi:MAG: PSD1 and planctomycete cytochrome C domain-containing protein [Planctomycetaceae bacterium]
MSIRSKLVGALTAGMAGLTAFIAPTRAADAERFFENKIRPLLAEHCFKCHGEEKHRGGLRLDSRGAILAGGDQGPAVVPGDAEESLLIRAVQQTDPELKMPPAPAAKLTKEQIADLTRWVAEGAVWPGDQAGPLVRRGGAITEQDRSHWAFQAVRRPNVPAVRDAGRVANPIDAFILEKLEARNLRFRRFASPRELVRRVYYDLTGLPPTPEEVEAFASDPSPAAYAALVDRLLDSPRYGEKWARHWLDLVRFAETNSYERDNPKPHAWRYRDYVIRAFNEDRPYDRFIREQLAGDELLPADVEASRQASDALIATGYYRLGIWDDEPTDRDQARYDGLDDIVATTGQVFLGLTLDCARCHDHKLDPIPQRDYYRFLSFFHNIQYYSNGGPTDELPLPLPADPVAQAEEHERGVMVLEQQREQLRTVTTNFNTEFAKLYEQVRGKRVESDEIPALVRAELARPEAEQLFAKERYMVYLALVDKLAALKNRGAVAAMALCVTEKGSEAPETFVLIRGNPRVTGDRVEPGFPDVLAETAPVIAVAEGAKSCGRRLALANWIASPENPLTARVMVNRIWQYHFGRGIVRSPNNFGVQGDKPTHPELLDWLAAEFVGQGWRLKPLHRLIVTSNVYRQSSSIENVMTSDGAAAADPTNDLFYRFDMRRLTAEEIRDSILAVSGNLCQKMYGPGVYVAISKEVLAGQQLPGAGWGKSPPEDQARRSIYIHLKRSLLTPLLESFDLAETDRSAAVRFTTTQPTQALTMLNSEFLHEQSERFADRLRRECGDNTAQQVMRALSLTTQRAVSEADVARGVRLIESLRNDDGAAGALALKYFCLVALNLNEFVYLD